MDELRFQTLSERHHGISPGVGSGYAEAARVCLDRHHVSAVDFVIEDDAVASAGRASWTTADERTRGAWNNATDATEAGACALALAAIENSRGLVAVKRAETKSGCDYYLDAPEAEIVDLETSLRLEISGVDEGAEGVVRTRLNRKLDQARNGDSNRPALACVVGFAALKIVAADA